MSRGTEPTPRPWRHSIGKVGVGALAAESPSRMYVVVNPNGASETALVTTYEDADLICAAVNAYVRLLAIEAAAREWLTADQAYIEADFGADEEEQAVAHVAKDALREALAAPLLPASATESATPHRGETAR